MDQPVRVGAVNYLNTKPLICDLEQLAPRAELVLDVPSRLADLLADGRLDVAPFRSSSISGPAATRSCRTSPSPRGPGAERDAVQPGAVADIRRVALDAGSRTSSALTQILLDKRYGACRGCPLPLERAAEDVDADAVLLIGDRAMRACLPGFAHAFDLGQEWFDWTGLPFVYAVWAVREGVDLRGVDEALRRPSSVGWTASAPSPTKRRRVWDWMQVFAGATCRTSCTLTWDRASRPGCTITTCWPASWDWPGEE